MTLLEAIRTLGTLDEQGTIYAAKPWTEDSQAIVVREPESGGLPTAAERLGLKYFLEVSIARDFLDDWLARGDARPTPKETCARLIRYAITDA